MQLSEVENKLKFKFPEKHRQALLDSSDPIHEVCEFLVLSDSDAFRANICRVNESLRNSNFDQWPDFLIAFASNSFGDYFAYDTRHNPATIIYIDPDNSLADNIRSSNKLCYKTFEEWYESSIQSTHRQKRKRSRRAKDKMLANKAHHSDKKDLRRRIDA